ncbi:MAG TPA: thiamine-phosphate kinase [Oscillatoriaceae cyanobacterium M33_DOE_052]|uniref:Thiamine-monophosphate kinase n=1 Tax=Planktothricoides sp. SpSt-374 TaxID=2282167 RepID=A0A7C3VL19_9CYAN|nr:thiamine-phosphate kinase [Oscillatoriaceae cyanobacterium M33_DOE_052]
MLVSDLGEKGLLERLHRFCPPEIIGDDGACIAWAAPESSHLVVTTDVLVDGVHFSDATTTAADAGWRAAAANLSDLAAMGAVPLGITVGLAVRGDTPVNWVEGLYEGMAACLGRYATPILGGDVVRSPVNTISITAFGWGDPEMTIRRANAQLGDAIVVTGWHGASRAGLELLLHPEKGTILSAQTRQNFIEAHRRPRPRLDVREILWDVKSSMSASPLRVAGMDSSDGLADAICQIAAASGCGATIERGLIPMPPALTAWLGEETAIDWALYGGEDFELVLCLPPESARVLVGKLKRPGAIVGYITMEPEVWLRDRNGVYPEQELSRSLGFQHF